MEEKVEEETKEVDLDYDEIIIEEKYSISSAADDDSSSAIRSAVLTTIAGPLCFRLLLSFLLSS